jgi:hypothetical protein
MALDNLSPVGIGFPVWFVLSAMNGAFDCVSLALGEVHVRVGGL